jgi:hypothetical protein
MAFFLELPLLFLGSAAISWVKGSFGVQQVAFAAQRMHSNPLVRRGRKWLT